MNKESHNVYVEWEAFCNYLITNNRFILNEKWKKFVKRIVTSAHKRKKKINAGEKFWRARIAKDFKIKRDSIVANSFTKDEMGVPPREKTKDGRANPKGIPYLYLTDDLETAIAETRPYLNANITLALFKLKKEVKVIDLLKDTFSVGELLANTKNNLNLKDEEKLLWSAINLYFSLPLDSDDKFGYIPTQYISELFKNNGYDGVMFRSAQKKEGINLVLFNPSNAEIIEIRQRSIWDIKYIDNMSYIKNS
jgi:hypothetical protein